MTDHPLAPFTSADKENKRQAIIAGLQAIETVTVGDSVFLSNHEALQVVAAVLFPDGIQTEAAYQTVVQVTEKACAHMGYGEETELGPPHVPFAKRGAYRQQYPPVDRQMVQAALELAGSSSTYPQQEIACTILWNKAGLAVYGRHWSQLADSQQTLIQTQVDAIAAQAGWHKDDTSATGSYTKPLPVDETKARSRLAEMLRRENGRPVSVSSVIHHLQLGAYGRGFYSDELTPALQAMLTETMQAHGYRPTAQDGEYRPLPVTLAADAAANIVEKLSSITPVMTEFGQALLLDAVLTVAVGQNQTVSDWQAAQLVGNGRIAQALRQVGYQTELTWCQPYHFQPKREARTERSRSERSRSEHDAQQVILKEVRIQNDPHKKLSLAKGLAVYTPALAIDDEDETLVYLEMLGAKQSVKANWAALVGGGKVHWLGRKRIRLDGMKAHVKIQATLPCGWANHILIHKQASLKEMNPEQPFYLLDDGKQAIPPLFYPMLNKCLALPLLPEWADVLWANGRSQQLITLLDKGEGQGYAAWRVLPSLKAWQEVVQVGLNMKEIRF